MISKNGHPSAKWFARPALLVGCLLVGMSGNPPMSAPGNQSLAPEIPQFASFPEPLPAALNKYESAKIPADRMARYLGAIKAKGLDVDFSPVNQSSARQQPPTDIPRPPRPSITPPEPIFNFRSSGSGPEDVRYSGLNPSQGLQIALNPSGLIITPDLTANTELQPTNSMSAADSNWLVSFKLASVNRGSSSTTLAKGELAVEDSRATYSREGITEWYINGPAGLEQGFTFVTRPHAHVAKAPESSQLPLRIELELESTLTPVLRPDQQTVEFRQENGLPVLRYSELSVQDARGMKLPARLELVYAADDFSPLNLLIIIDDLSAFYPITVDPILEVRLVKDINVLTTGMVNGMTVYGVEMGGFFYFNTATSDHTESALWRTDGTEAGTQIVVSMPTRWIAALQGTILFYAYEPLTGWALWKTDGNGDGTTLVKDINPQQTFESNFIENWVAQGSVVMFMADDGVHGVEPWRSDGTGAGTYMLKDINPGPGNGVLTTVDFEDGTMGELWFFAGYDPVNGTELWRSDGTIAGTFLLKDICPGSCGALVGPYNLAGPYNHLLAVGNTLYFTTSGVNYKKDLWKTDGTSGGTMLVKQATADSYVGMLLGAVGTTLIFSGPGHHSLWRCDGTPESTYAFLSENIDSPQDGEIVGQSLYFTNYTASNGRELWKTDGTAAGTLLVKDILPGNPACFSAAYPQLLTSVGNLLYFVAYEASTGLELWRSDGTEMGTTLVKDVHPDAVPCDYNWSGEEKYPFGLLGVGETLYFMAEDIAHGNELWKSDGTAEGTSLLKDIRTDTQGSLQSTHDGEVFIEYNGALYFWADDGINGTELWKSDGSAEGTVMVKDICPGSSGSVAYFCRIVGNKLLFSVRPYWSSIDRVPGELWASDGTESGTVFLKRFDYPGNTRVGPKALGILGDILFFSEFEDTSGTELWASNGTSTGTILVKDIYPGSASSNPSTLTQLGKAGYFLANEPVHGTELWRTDGTSAGTWLVIDLCPGSESSWISNITAFNGNLYIRASSTPLGPGMWRSDGTSSGTVPFGAPDLGINYFSGGPVAILGNNLLFRGEWKSDEGYELWKTNGLPGGTALILANGFYNSLRIVGQTYFFIGYNSLTGYEPGKSDGTAAGTTALLRDIYPGPRDSLNMGNNTVADVNGVLFFTALSPTFGGELWKSDGTGLGTVLVKDIWPGSKGSDPSWGPNGASSVDGALFFNAYEPSTGRELWVTDGTETGTFMVADINPEWTIPDINTTSEAISSNPARFAHFNGRIYFGADDGKHGYEVMSLYEVNVPPAVTITSPASGFLAPINTPINFTGFFSDWIWDRPHTALWSFASATIPLIQTNGILSEYDVAGSMAFSTPGIYTVELAVTDNKGTTGTASMINGLLPAYVVVFDPYGSFVTGGGWIWSPPGAYRPGMTEYATFEGKATFGFVAKYLKGANIPTGDTQFQFKAGDLNFKSIEYQWLVVAGARAQYKGSGTVNGTGDYGFMLTAIDGQLPGGRGYDRFRIKIWDKATDLLVYDNHVGGADNSVLPDSTIIRGGSIVIH